MSLLIVAAKDTNEALEPIKTELFIAEEHYNSLAEEYGVPQIGDILITSVGTIGNTCYS